MRVISRLVVRCEAVKRRIDRQCVFPGDELQDGLAVADGVVAVDDIGQLTARRLRGVENMLVPERHPRQPQEREHFQAIAVIVGDAEQRGIGVKRQHPGTPEVGRRPA